MTLQDRNLREQTLFALYDNPAVNDTELALREALNSVVNKIYTTKGDWTRAKSTEITKAIANELKVPYDSLLPKVNKDLRNQFNTVSLFKLDTATMAKILDPNQMIQGYTVKGLFKDLSDNHIKQLQVTFASAVARGAPTPEIVNLLTTKNTALTKNQMKAAVTTMGLEARAAVRHDNYKELESQGLIDGYTYNATMDGRTTEYCRNHDGRTYWKPIKDIAGQINVHFRCRSVFVPTVKKPDVRATVFGPTTDETYSKWFSRQPEDFQKSTLGPKRFNLYKNGQYVVGGLSDIGVETLSLAVINDLLYSPSIAYKGDMSDEIKLISKNITEDTGYYVRQFVEKNQVLGVGTIGFQSTVVGDGLFLSTKLDTVNKTANIHRFILPDIIRGKGYSKSILNNIITDYKNYGVSKVSLTAAEEDGVSFWLYMGFQPTDPLKFKTLILDIDPAMDNYLKEWSRGDYTALSEMIKRNPELSKKLKNKVVDMSINLSNYEQRLLLESHLK